MTTSYSPLLGMALPVTGELSGAWGDTVNNYITSYVDASVAGTQTISGSQTAVTLSVTTATSLTQAGTGATGSAQYQIINCTGNPASLLTITAPAASKTYLILNATSTSQSVKIVGAGPTTGVTLIAGEKAVVAWNGSDFVKVSTTATAAGSNTQVQYNSSGNLAGSANLTFDGTYLTANSIKDSALTATRVTYAGASGLLQDSANLTFDGTSLTLGGNPTLSGGTANGVTYLNASKVLTSGSALTFDGTNLGVTNGVTTLNQTTNGSALLVTGTTGSATNNYISLNHSPGGGAYSYTAIQIAGADIFSAGGNLSSYGGSAIINSPGSSGSVIFKTFSSEQMRLTSAGNLGLGVTPSTWSLSGLQALQVKNASLAGYLANNYLSANAYYNGGWKYISTDYASQYQQISGGHQWFTASSGTAGAAISFTQAMTLDSSGNLGIGTTSPGSRLVVYGTTDASQRIVVDGTGNVSSLKVRYNGSDIGFLQNYQNSELDFGTAVNAPVLFYINNAEQMRLNSTGLGIGTSSPAEKLDVNGAIRVGGSSSNARTIWGSSTYLQFNSGTSGYSWNNSNNTAGLMLLDSSGNLGLGVTPSAWTAFTAIQIGALGGASLGGTTNNTIVGSNMYYNAGFKYAATGSGTTYYQQTNSEHRWYTAPSGTANAAISFTQAMTLDADGSLAVGVTSKLGSSLLTVAKNIDTEVILSVLNTNTGSNAGARLNIGSYDYSNSELSLFAYSPTATGSLYGITLAKLKAIIDNAVTSASNGLVIGTAGANPLYFITGSTERARIDSSGNLLVGTTSSSNVAGNGIKLNADNRLSVVNNGSVEGFIYYNTSASAYRFYVSGNGTISATNTTISAISDIRFKENVRDLDVGLDKIMALKPRLYDWKEGKGANIKNARGFIAQEFEQVFPDLIDEWKDPAPEGEEPYKSVRADLIPVLVKAIQEQQALIVQLQNRLADAGIA